MIYHQSPYGQILKFSSRMYYTISDEKLAEIEQNCANIDREVISIGDSLSADFLDISTEVDLPKEGEEPKEEDL